uniref:Uncharacterized protein n=1 Tax=Aegilops tauschii subsp. strangulata TaxID=200361 RepID=A0A453A3D3_AEGTS
SLLRSAHQPTNPGPDPRGGGRKWRWSSRGSTPGSSIPCCRSSR